MAAEFNVTANDKYFLGDDKVLEFTIVGQDGVTPFDVTGLSLEWNLRRTDKDPVALITKGIGSGLTIVGVYSANPSLNTQRVRVSIASADTDLLKPNVAYRHSLKRKDAGFEMIASYGSILFLQATER
jgi:hypothetical protein